MKPEEIKAGLDRYTKSVKAKLDNTKNLSAKYIVKEHSALINDGNDLFYVYAHYPTTEPDVMVMAFTNKVNAELFCEALNAENERIEADPAKHGYKDYDAVAGASVCSECGWSFDDTGGWDYCPHCGTKWDGDSK